MLFPITKPETTSQWPNSTDGRRNIRCRKPHLKPDLLGFDSGTDIFLFIAP